MHKEEETLVTLGVSNGGGFHPIKISVNSPAKTPLPNTFPPSRPRKSRREVRTISLVWVRVKTLTRILEPLLLTRPRPNLM